MERNMKFYIFLFCFKLVWCNDPKQNETKTCVFIKYDTVRDEKKYGTCKDNDICRRQFSIAEINLPPYSIHPVIQRVLKECCNCTNLTINKILLRNISDLSVPKDLKQSDFIYPVLGSSNKQTMYGLNFVPLYDVTDYYYVTNVPPTIFVRMMKSMSKVYPLLILVILMTGLSGFITWLIETWHNKEDFPRPFLTGWFEGMWWSFISMTTVGYGDKTPKTIGGRLFASVWILIGITMFGILTGLITSAIQDAETPVISSMKHKNVGVLRYRTLDISFLATSGGKAVQSDASNYQMEILSLIWKLKKEQIDGILLDKSTYDNLRFESHKSFNISDYDNFGSYMTDSQIEGSLHYFNNSIEATHYPYAGEKMSYGILIKDSLLYNYLHDAISDNRMILRAEEQLRMNGHKNEHTDYALFDIDNPYFHSTVIVLVVTIAVACVIGFMVEKSEGRWPCSTTRGRVNMENK